MALRDWLRPGEKAAAAANEELRGQVVAALRTLYDPEIPVNIYDLGLVYGLDVDAAAGRVHVRMTLTAPGCPVAQSFPNTVGETVAALAEVKDVTVEMVWEPPWSQEMMSEAARLELGML